MPAVCYLSAWRQPFRHLFFVPVTCMVLGVALFLWEGVAAMKIGLIAMSGIRCYDAELLSLGLTLPGFVERSKTIASLPSLGLLTLAGMTPPEHEVRYLEIPDIRAADDPPRRLRPRGHLELLRADRRGLRAGRPLPGRRRARRPRRPARQRPARGGGAPTPTPSWSATASCTGRASSPTPPPGSSGPGYGSLDDDYDLADAPLPAFELLDIDRYNRLTVQTSRGCPHRCEFCAGSILFCRRYRQKPAAKVLAEIDRILELWKHPFIELADDNSFVDRAYWLELLPEIAKRHIRWFTETDISVGEDDELLDLLRESGCAEVLIGLESPVADGLDGVETRANWKLKRLPRYREALRNIQEHGIRVNGCFVLGLDGQGPEIFDQRARLRQRTPTSSTSRSRCSRRSPARRCTRGCGARAGCSHDGDWRRCTLFDLNFSPSGMSAEQLAAGFRSLGVDLYSAEWTERRRHRFNERLRERRHREKGGTVETGTAIGVLFGRGPLRRSPRGGVPGRAGRPVRVVPRDAAQPLRLRSIPGGDAPDLRADVLRRRRQSRRNRNLIPYGSCSSWPTAVSSSTTGSAGAPDMWKPFAVFDVIFAILFFWSWRRLEKG